MRCGCCACRFVGCCNVFPGCSPVFWLLGMSFGVLFSTFGFGILSLILIWLGLNVVIGFYGCAGVLWVACLVG